MTEDIRNRPALTHADVVGLNFIRDSERYIYRRHFRTGLRSHIMEVLERGDVAREREGVQTGRVRRFPRANPLRMLRIFRTRFESVEDAREEVRRVKVIGKYLGPDHFAFSEEFLADYACSGRRHVLLCGLQEYVEGEILDPWRHDRKEQVRQILRRLDRSDSKTGVDELEERFRGEVRDFVQRIKAMVKKTHLVPDLAGVGNLLVTPGGDIRLVDINNVSRVSYTSITVDDRGYPVCDKSVEALSCLEGKIAGTSLDPADPLYRTFLDPERMEKVRVIEQAFHESMKRGEKGLTLSC